MSPPTPTNHRQPTETEYDVLCHIRARQHLVEEAGIVSELGTRKGFDKVREALDKLIRRNQIVVDEKGKLSVPVAA